MYIHYIAYHSLRAKLYSKILLKYLSLHNIKEGDAQYPAAMLITADHNGQVVPFYSLKFIAYLQNVLRYSKKQTNPILIETKDDHDCEEPTKSY